VSHTKYTGNKYSSRIADEERQQKEQNITIRTGASSVDAKPSAFFSLSLSLCPVYNFFSFFAHVCVWQSFSFFNSSKPGNPFFFYLFCSDAIAVITHSPKEVVYNASFLKKKNWGVFLKTKKKEAWTKLLRRDEGKIEKEKKKAKSQIITGNSRDGAQMVRHGITKLYKLAHRVVCSCSPCVDVF
jgi:hypothetical protein